MSYTMSYTMSSASLLLALPKAVVLRVVKPFLAPTITESLQLVIEELRFLYGAEKIYTRRVAHLESYLEEATARKDVKMTGLLWDMLRCNLRYVCSYIECTPPYTGMGWTGEELAGEYSSYMEFYEQHKKVSIQEAIDLNWIPAVDRAQPSVQYNLRKPMFGVLLETVIWTRIVRARAPVSTQLSFSAFCQMFRMLEAGLCSGVGGKHHRPGTLPNRFMLERIDLPAVLGHGPLRDGPEAEDYRRDTWSAPDSDEDDDMEDWEGA